MREKANYAGSFDGSQSATADANADPVDVFVGEQVRAFRKSLRTSQTDLASAIGVTFQQVQKYERGANRVSASKLCCIASHLEQPVARFFPPIRGAGARNLPEVGSRRLVTADADEFLDMIARIPGDDTRRCCGTCS